jgi:hypothetical protein
VQLLALLLALVASLPGPAQPPRRDLAADEACGGHTLARHVAKTNRELAERLRQEPDISAASTYTDRQIAETVIGAALVKERSRIAAWSKRSGPRPNLALRYASPGDRLIGRSWQRGRIAPNGCTEAVIVLRWDVSRRTFCVLTSYPEVAR